MSRLIDFVLHMFNRSRFAGAVDTPDSRDYIDKPLKGIRLPKEVDLWRKAELIHLQETGNPLVFNKQSRNSCFHRDTMVLTEGFVFRPIRTLGVGSLVYTHEGNLKRVVRKIETEHKERLLGVRCRGIPSPVRCTGNHPFLTNKGWVEAKDLTKEHFIAIPTLNKTPISTPIFKWEDDDDFLWVIGMYLAEGSNSAKQAVFSLHINETEYADKIKKTIEKYGGSVGIHKDPEHNRQTVFVSGYFWAEVFEEMGGKHCDKKRLPHRFMMMSPEKQYFIYQGWHDGDGWQNRERECTTTTSKKLAWQMYYVLLRNNIRGSLNSTIRAEGRLRSYDLCFSRSTVESKASREKWGYFDGDTFYAKVFSITKEDRNYWGKVHNLEVEDDESYIVDSMAVHNCTAFSISYCKILTNLCKGGEVIKHDPEFQWKKQEEEFGANRSWGCTLQGALKAVLKWSQSYPIKEYRKIDKNDLRQIKCRLATGSPVYTAISWKRTPDGKSNTYSTSLFSGIWEWFSTKLLGGHACCLPDTEVTTSVGKKKITEVAVGDKVMTREGLKEVLATSETPHDGDTYKISSPLTFDPLVVTGNHPVLVKKKAKQTKIKQCLAFDGFEDTLEFIPAEKVRPGHLVVSPIDTTVKENTITNDFARLLGYYVGDGNLQLVYSKNGNVKSGKFRLTYHRSDKREIVEDLIEIVAKYDKDINYSIYEDKKSLANIITFYSTKLTKEIAELCGTAKNKYLSNDILYMETEKQLEFLKGWHKTDGTGDWLEVGEKPCQIFTAEEILAKQMTEIIKRCNLTYSMQRRAPEKDVVFPGGIYNTKGGYTIFFHSTRNGDRIKYHNGLMVAHVDSIEIEEYEGNVYNLQVKDCPEYIANDLLVHNCCIYGFNDKLNCLLAYDPMHKQWGKNSRKGELHIPYTEVPHMASMYILKDLIDKK